MNLFRNGKPTATIFDVLGSNENDMTASMAFVLASCPHFLSEVVNELVGQKSMKLTNPTIHIQTARRGEGITDIELNGSPDLFAICEAKRGPELPSLQQLERYAPIVLKSQATKRFLVTISNATHDVATIHYNPMSVRGIPLVHMPWRAIRHAAQRAMAEESNANKQILNQFCSYLGGLLGMETKYSNMVYVVSLSSEICKGWKLSWIDVVEQRDCYFYPVGNGWPDPPNYMGFRYGGKLQSVRTVLSYKVVHDLSNELNGAAKEDWGPLYLLKLGKPIIPQHEVKNGPKILRANRCWCMIDTLLIAPTISDALVETKRRQATDA